MTAINGTPRPIHPPQNTTRTTVRRTSRPRPSRRRALAVAVTATLLAGVSIAIDAAATNTPASPGTSSRPIGISTTHLPNPLLGPTGIAPAPLSQGSHI